MIQHRPPTPQQLLCLLMLMALPTAPILAQGMPGWWLTLLLSILPFAQAMAVASRGHHSTCSRSRGTIVGCGGSLVKWSCCTLGSARLAVLICDHPCIASSALPWIKMAKLAVRKSCALRLGSVGERTSQFVCVVDHTEAYLLAIQPHCM